VTLTYLDLTPAQRTCLDETPFTGNHLVSGPPGSGKSLLAAQRAIMLALTGPASHLLTRSNLLRQALTPTVTALGPRDGSVHVTTAHAWLAQWYGPNAPRTDDGWYDWPSFYQRAAQSEPDPDLTLVIDEGQDLPPEFYRLCRILGARTTVYADECQRLTDTNSTLAEVGTALGQYTRHILDGNHRNTHQIAELASHFHTGPALPSLPERDGPAPWLHRLSGPDTVVELLISLAQRNPHSSIGVILHASKDQLDLFGRLERRAPRLKPQLYTSQATQGRYRNLDLTRPGVVVVNRASAKGLGFDIVVIPDTHTDASTDPTAAALRMAYYVLTTRAGNELHLGYAGTTEPPLLAPIPPRLLLRS
jgi:superfamily I DNA/RNA helicase